MQVKHRNLYSMGTRLDLVLVDIDDKKADTLLSQVTTALDEIVDILSIYKPDSELSLLNSKAALAPVVVSKLLYDILDRCKYFYKITSGIFDISADIKISGEVADKCFDGMNGVVLDPEKLSVEFKKEYLKLDPGGFGKGLALEEIRKILISSGVENALVSFGESSVLGIGTHPYGESWPIGIADIFNPAGHVKVVELVDSGLSTSGSGTLDSKGQFSSYNNIINPLSHMPVKDPCTVSVRCDDMVLAEALSTALLIDRTCLKKSEALASAFEAYGVYYNAEQQFELIELFK